MQQLSLAEPETEAIPVTMCEKRSLVPVLGAGLPSKATLSFASRW
jgi:hypothetical protein